MHLRPPAGRALGVLLAACAVLATPTFAGPPERAMRGAFDDAQVQRALAEAREEHDRRREARDRPEERARRRRSRDEYAGQSRTEALETGRRKHRRVFRADPWRALELRAGERVEAYRGDYSALVAIPGDRQLLVESALPLRALDAGGDLAPVDLRLQDRGGHLAPQVPLVATKISEAPGGEVEFERGGYSFALVGAGGERAVLTDGKAFYANALHDTDYLIRSTPYGVETFFQVRSAASPEEATLRFELPTGTSLRKERDGRAIEIVRDGEVVGLVEAPSASDADGEDVPVTLAVEGSSVVVRFPHRDSDLAYPVLVDPIVGDTVHENFNLDGNGTRTWPSDPFSGWGWAENGAAGYFPHHISQDASSANRGLTVYAYQGATYYDGWYGEWYWQAPRESYIERADFGYVDHTNPWGTCVIEGIYSWKKFDWDYGTWRDVYNNTGSSPTLRSSEACRTLNGNYKAHCVGSSCIPHSPAGDARGTPGNLMVFGMLKNGTHTLGSYPIVRMEGATMWLYDNDVPSLAAPSHSGLPSGWTHSAQITTNVSATEPDPGLGVKYFNLYRDGAYIDQRPHDCDGDRHSRCPVSWSSSFSYSTDSMAEGVRTMSTTAFDALVKSGSQSSSQWTVRVDRSAPVDRDPAGTLWAERGDFVTKDSYTLRVDGRDDHSGVKSVAYKIRKGSSTGPVVLEGTASNPSCNPTTGCSLDFSNTFTIDATKLADDTLHTVEVITKDQLGDDPTHGGAHTRTRTFSIEVDRKAPTATVVNTGLRPWMRDGETLTTKLNGTDASSGVKTFRLDYPAGAPTVVTRSCSGIGASRCKGSDSHTFNYKTIAARFPDGKHEVRASVTDAVGRTSPEVKWFVNVDRDAPDVTLTGGLHSFNPTGRDLRVEAYDGGPNDLESGVASIELRIDRNGDGDVIDADEQAAIRTQPACDGCSLTLDYALPADFPEGPHKAQVRVLDHAGNEALERWTFYLVNTLPGSRSRLGLEGWWQFDSTDAGGGSRVHVNAETGNAVWHSVPIVNRGRGLSTVVNLTYNAHDRGGLLGSLAGRVPLVDGSALNLSNELPGLAYAEAGPGFSISVSGPTRVNEPLGGAELAALKTRLKRDDPSFGDDDWVAFLDQELGIPIGSSVSPTPLGDQITLTDADGTVHTFQRGQGDTWIDPAGLEMHLREYEDGPDFFSGPGGGFDLTATRGEPIERKWAMTRPDGVTHFFDSLGYQRETRDRNGNTLRYEYERYDAISGTGEGAAGTGPCDLLPIGITQAGRLCVPRLRRVVDPAGVEAEPGGAGATGRTLAIDYVPGGLLAAGEVPFESPVPFPGLLGGKAGRIASITDHDGRTTELDYDEDGQLVRLVEAAEREGAALPERRVTKFEWEAKDPGLLNDPDLTVDDGLGQDRHLTAVVEVRDADGDGRFSAGESEVEHARTTLAYEARTCTGCNVLPGVLQAARRTSAVTSRRGFARRYAYGQSGSERTLTVDADVATGKVATSRHTVDDRGRPTKVVDPLGRQTALAWTAENRTSSVTAGIDADGSTANASITDMTYNQNGLLATRTTWPGGKGQPNSVARTLVLSYRDGSGTYQSRATGVNDAAGTFVSDLRAIENPKPGTGWTFDLDTRGNVTARTDARGHAVKLTPDAFGRVEREEDELGNVTKLGPFHATGAPLRVVTPRGVASGEETGHTWRYCYDDVGNVTHVTDPRGAAPQCSSTTATAYTALLEYDAFDRLVSETAPLDSANADPTMPAHTNRETRYDRNGNVLEAVDAKGERTDVSHTKMDRPARVDAPGSDGREITTFEYDGLDRVTKRADPRGSGRSDGAFSTDFELDAAGQLVAEVRHGLPTDSPATLVTSYAYDTRGNVVGVNDPRRNVGKTVAQAVAAAAPSALPRFRRAYNGVDELTDVYEDPTEAGPDRRSHFEYDPNGNRVVEVSPRGYTEGPESAFTTTTELDHRDQVVAVTRPSGSGGDFVTTRYGRRCDGKVVALSAPRGVANGAVDAVPSCRSGGPTMNVSRYYTTRYAYDENGELQSRSVPFAPGQYGRSDAALASWKVSYTRDEVGNPITVRDARGNSFTNQFFASGQLASTERPSWWALDWGAPAGGPDPGRRYEAADTADLDVPVNGPSLVEARSGGGASGSDELPGSTGVAGNFGSVEPESLPDLLPRAGTTTFRYDAEQRLTAVSDDGRTRTIGYDAAGRIATKEWPLAAAAGGQPARTIRHSFAYDGHGNLTRSRVDGVAGVGDVDATFGYDGYDRRVEERTEGARSDEGDTIDEEITRFVYDANGNLERRLTPRAAATGDDGYAFRFGYDSLDQLESERNPAGETWTYGYDIAGNVTRETSPRGNAGDTAPAGQSFATTFAYDRADRLARATDGAGGVTLRSYDADGNLARTQAPGSAARQGGQQHDRVVETVHDGRGLPWKETVGTDDGDGSTSGDRRTRILEFDPSGNPRRVVDPKGVTGSGESAAPRALDDGSDGSNPDTSANISRATEHATLTVSNADGLATHVYLPWGSDVIDRPGSHPDDRQDERRYKQLLDRDARGLVRNVFAAHRVGASSAAQVSYTYFDTDWVASSSDERLRDPAPPNATIYTQQVAYDYDERGNQTLWRTRNAESSSKGREVRRSFYPNGLLRSREAEKVTEDGSGDETTTRRYAYFYNENRSLVRMDDDDPGRSDNPARSTTFSRDAAERELVVNERWEKGKDTVFSYDTAGNVKERRTDGRLAPDGTYGDSDGGRDDAKTTRFTYDALDRETLATVSQGGMSRETARTYWPSGDPRTRTRQRAGTADASYVVDEWFYSVQGEPSLRRTVRHGPSGSTREQAYAYDENGNRTKDERGTHRFNSRNQLVRWERAKRKPGTVVYYDVSGSGAVEKEIDTAEPATSQVTTNSYNGTRLVSSETDTSRTAFHYDDLGSVVRTEVELKTPLTTLPPVNQLPATPQTCGELDVSRNVTRYCYDEFERLVAAKGPGLATDESAVYTYDGLDRRDTKRVRLATGGEATRDLGYVGMARLLSREQDRQGEVKYYDYSAQGEREGQAVAADGTAPTSYRSYAKDANGSVLELEETDGSVKAGNEYVYDPYGDLDAAGDGATSDPEESLGTEARGNPFRFEGFYYDSGIKTYDMGARQYRPDVGRFLTQDRFESARGDLALQSDPLTQNRYAFAGGNPVSFVEFDGHDPHAAETHARGCFSCDVSLKKERRAARVVARYMRSQSRAHGVRSAFTPKEQRTVIRRAARALGQRGGDTDQLRGLLDFGTAWEALRTSEEDVQRHAQDSATVLELEAAIREQSENRPGYWDYFWAFNKPDATSVAGIALELFRPGKYASRLGELRDLGRYRGAGDALVDAERQARSGVRLVGGRRPINSRYAGRTHPSGVRFTDEGFPDFSPYAKARVELTGLTGNYRKDSALANQAVGLPRTPRGLVWHHVEDARTMLLVPRSIHRATPHTGGAAVIRHGGR